jgi:PAS domain S-box-containing protein
MRLIDHTSARIFWDLVNAREKLKFHLREKTILEQKITRDRRYLQALFDAMPDLIAVVGTDRRVRRVNASLAEFTAVTQADAAGATCRTLFAKTELDGHCHDTDDVIDYVFETGMQRSLIWQALSPEETYWEVTITPIKDDDGKVVAVVAIWHHITERVMLHRQIESAEHRFKSFIDSAHDWISIKDLEGRYLIVNPVCAHAFGREPDEYVGKGPEDMFTDESQVRMIKQHDREVIESGHHRTYDEVFPIDGRERHYQTVRFPLTDYEDKIIGVCTIARDVTSERELQDELVQAARLAAVGKMAAGVAHEINNPLTGVLAFAEDILEELDPKSELRDDVRVIIRETKRCRKIVRNLLDFSRQERMVRRRTDPNSLLTGTLNLIRKLPQFRNITIIQNLTRNLPAVECDRQRMQQVILNLMINAAEAMKENGTITLSTEYDRERDRCVLAIEDDGPGIPENLIDKIFEPFFSTKGTNGLGLVVSWGIVERHRGTIEVDTSPSWGAIFRIFLPAADGSAERPAGGGNVT